ncbi:MAG: type II toxin-antitoxin system YoeB family toxin [Paucibacter sp.]|nr:type II toxin-antitoxin system YoeB family toxin [Roseateles sp.]
MAGSWSRRMTDEHWVDGKIDGDALLLAKLRSHY